MFIVIMKISTILCFILIYNVNLAISSILTTNNVLNIIKFYTLQSNVELSDLCKKQSDIYYKTLITQASTEDEWAKQMMDASSKFQAGLYFGNVADLGAFDECLRINHNIQDIKGKYCLTKLRIPSLYNKSLNHIPWNNYDEKNRPENFARRPPEFTQRWSICVPHGCTAKDIETHLNSYDKNLNFTVEEEYCQTIESQPKLNSGDWTILGILIALACVIILSTSYDVYLQHINKDPIHPLMIAFSWYTSFQKLIKINNNPDLLPCLNGIRVLSMFWIIHGHETSDLSLFTLFNSKDALYVWLRNWWALFTVGSSVSVDTFFFLSGILLMYGFLKSQAKKLHFNIPIFYIHRYLRLTPAYAAVIVLYITVFIKLGSGPSWETVTHSVQDDCKEYWWSSLLYIHNFVNPENNCVGQSWYLAVDMQLYILSPLILVPVGKWPKITPYLFGILVVVFTIIPTVVAWQYEIPALALNAAIPKWHAIYYAQVHTRAGTWIIGLALGYILFKTKHKKYRINKILVALLWLISATVMLYIVFGNYPALDENFEYSRVYNSLFTGFHRNIWALGLSWIVFACINGYGGPVNWFLSLSVFQFFAKLTYCLYLLHRGVQFYNRGIVRVPIFFTNYQILQSFFSTTCITIFISIFWMLCFEAPFAVIDGVIIKAVRNLWKK